MTKETLIAALLDCDSYFAQDGIATIQYWDTDRAHSEIELLDHCRWMCQEALWFVKDGQVEKAMRWLGFVQGVLAYAGVCTIDDLREMSRG